MRSETKRLILQGLLRTLGLYVFAIPVALLQYHSRWLSRILVCAGAVYVAQSIVWLGGLYKQPDARARAQRAARFLFKVVLGLAVLALLLQLGLYLLGR